MNKISYSNWLLEKASHSETVTKKSDRTRMQLKIATSTLLNHTPYQTLHITDICKKANVGAGTFYRYFKGKKEITEEILEEVIQQFSNLMPIAGQKSEHNSIFELFTAANVNFFKLAEANPGIFRCLLHANAQEYQLGIIVEKSTSSLAKRVTKSILLSHIELIEDNQQIVKLNEACTLTMVHCLASMLDDLAARLTFRDDKILKSLFEDNNLDIQNAAKFLAILWHRVIFGCDPEGHTPEEFFSNKVANKIN